MLDCRQACRLIAHRYDRLSSGYNNNQRLNKCRIAGKELALVTDDKMSSDNVSPPPVGPERAARGVMIVGKNRGKFSIEAELIKLVSRSTILQATNDDPRGELVAANSNNMVLASAIVCIIHSIT